MTAIYHNRRSEIVFRQHFLGLFDVLREIVRLFAAAQDYMDLGVPGGLDYRCEAVTVYAEKGVGVAGGDHGVYGDLQVSVGAVLEPDREREAAGQFPMGLGFGGPGADRAPAEHVRQVLRGYRVEH